VSPDAQVDVRVEGIRRPGQSTDDLSMATRAALHLPVDRPIIATGHQAALHHGGIVAKVMAAHAMAARHEAADVFVLIDTVPDAVFQARRPRNTPKGWEVQRVSLAKDSPEPLCRRGPAALQDAAQEGIDLPKDVPAREQAVALLRWQWSHWSLQPALCQASALLHTPGGRHVLGLLANDPQTASRLLGEAIRASGVSDVRIPAGGDDPELPLWAISTAESGKGKRCIARASDLDRADVVLQPRAVLTTLLMRHFVCDLFVHGTGGARYDRITEHWARTWLDCSLDPVALVTADVRLDADALTAARAAQQQAQLQLRRVLHDGDVQQSGGPSPDKARLLAQIDTLPKGSAARSRAFAEMHAALQDGVETRLAPAREHLEAMQRDVDVLSARDWPLVWLPRARATTLRGLIDAAC
jgi:hypothetical protein